MSKRPVTVQLCPKRAKKLDETGLLNNTGGTTGGTVVTRGMTGGKGFVTRGLSWELEGGKKAMCLDGDYRDAGLTLY